MARAGCMLRQYGLRTLSERWDRPGSSLNHCMFGHIQEWFQKYLLGIRQVPGGTGSAHIPLVPNRYFGFSVGVVNRAIHFDLSGAAKGTVRTASDECIQLIPDCGTFENVHCVAEATQKRLTSFRIDVS